MPTSVPILTWGAAIAIIALAALIDVLGRARRLRRPRALSDLAALTWQQFEEVIADAFRRNGYRVREMGGRGRTDGGADLVLLRDGRLWSSSAKHWRSPAADDVDVLLVYPAATLTRHTPWRSRSATSRLRTSTFSH